MAAAPRARAALGAAAQPERADGGAAVLERLFDEVIRERAGPELAEALALMSRPGGTRVALAAWGSAQLGPLVRACSMQLALENVVDEVRRASALGARSDPDPLLAALSRAGKEGAADTPVDVRLVLTAHPTDLARRSVLTKQRAVGDALEHLLEREPAVTGNGHALRTPPEALVGAARRELWLDALADMQVELLKRHRAGDRDAREPLLATVAGIATGLRTTG
jgi:phosphoenolpyruvate carboxylase